MTTQISTLLPAQNWTSVAIHENGEPLVVPEKNRHIILGGIQKGYEPSFMMRKTVALLLASVANNLPSDLRLVLIEGHRSIESQQLVWNTMWHKMFIEHLDWSEENIEKAVRMSVAKPGPHANHLTGGAVDVTLMRTNGTYLDMGTPYISQVQDVSVARKFPMFALNLTKEQIENRTMLRNAMARVGFVYYPGEWWHYCFWDRMWAGYTGRKECFYGPV